jgi:hypothetical protein
MYQSRAIAKDLGQMCKSTVVSIDRDDFVYTSLHHNPHGCDLFEWMLEGRYRIYAHDNTLHVPEPKLCCNKPIRTIR